MSNTLIWRDGRWQADACWPANDRGLQYGDGLFETLRMAADGSLPLWPLHRARLLKGLVALDFPVNTLALIEAAIAQAPRTGSAVKLVVTRGAGPRGYLAPVEPEIELQWQVFNAPDWALQRKPEGFHCEFSEVRLAPQPLLAGFKHLNRLEQVLIRNRMPGGSDEAIVLDADDWVIEGAMSNLFVCEQGQWLTPDLSRCGVDGVIRRWLMGQLSVQETAISPDRLLAADAILLTNSLNGLQAVRSIGAKRYDSPKEIVVLQQELQELFA
ncbi:aminodeoxychorismate lyase [Thalassolituus sp. LLYu03]|uniref:aminodeoxychorismate lyase n=1 Tax=Thalassolituus sp. LLYu03 TaxID=3421656 RepID=UPI003D2795F5